MGTNIVSPGNVLDIIRRARLYNPNFGLDQAPSQIPAQAPQADLTQIQAPVQAPAQAPSPLDQAASQYRQAMQQPVPTQADYHPSVLRRIIGATLGATVGMTRPQAGVETAQNIVYGPYQKQLSDYQKRLAQKKEAYETEEKVAEGGARIGELGARKGAELERAGAEKERRGREAAETRALTPGTPEFEGKERLLRIQYPDDRFNKFQLPVELELENGKTITPAYEQRDGQYRDTAGNLYGSDAIKAIYKPGAKPKEPVEKSHTEYNDFYAGMKAKNPNMTDDEIAAKYKQLTPAERDAAAPVVIDADTGKVVALKPGMTAPKRFKTAAGESSEVVGTAPTRQMAETVPKVIDLVDRTVQLINQQIKSLGPAASRWSEFMSGKVGAPNPEFTRLRTNAALLQTLLLRMHIGARGGERILEHFKDLIDVGKQSPENMLAALEEIKNYANDIGKSSGSQGTEKIIDYVNDPKTGKLVPKK
jgi:hypothetical protein